MSPILGIWASQISGRLWEPAGAYDALATVTVPSGGAASVTFAGIPTGYKHLQMRYLAQSAASSTDQMIIRFNSDSSASNYTTHQLQGNGSAASAYGFGTGGFPGAYLDKGINGSGLGASIFSVGVVDLLDYANTSKFKTMRALDGYDANGSGFITLQSALWLNTTAINSLTMVNSGGTNFSQNSQFALYGIK
jgi:hypothetical protein